MSCFYLKAYLTGPQVFRNFEINRTLWSSKLIKAMWTHELAFVSVKESQNLAILDLKGLWEVISCNSLTFCEESEAK